LLTLSKSFC